MQKSVLMALIALITLNFSFFCSIRHGESSKKNIDFNSLKVIRKNVAHFSELGKIKKAIKLETIEDSLLGTVNLVVVDNASGDLFISDNDSTRKVLRFNSEGKFITAYGKIGEGPGEYKRLIGFDINNSGDVCLLTQTKLIKYSKNGPLIKEKRLDFVASDITIINDLIYISIMDYRRDLKNKKAILLMDEGFEEVGRIGIYDPRIEKYKFMGLNVLAKRKGKLYYIENYDLAINIFAPMTRESFQLTVPNENADLEKTWGKRRLSENDRQKIRNKIHRFVKIHGYYNGLFLIEMCREKNIFDCWLLNLEKKVNIIVPFNSMVGGSEKNLYFDLISGSYSNGIIGVFDNAEVFNRYKGNYSILKDIEFKNEDNPILVFFEFDQLAK